MFFFIFLLLWIIFNGKLTLEIFLIGCVISAALFVFCIKFLNYNFKREIKYAGKTLYMLEYVFVLFKEIVLANIMVFKIILTNQEIKPILYSFYVDLETDEAKVILSHSITLTPGTITVELIDNIFVVHCLDESMADGMKDSSFVKLLRKIEA